jgi:hypothetical protein
LRYHSDCADLKEYVGEWCRLLEAAQDKVVHRVEAICREREQARAEFRAFVRRRQMKLV